MELTAAIKAENERVVRARRTHAGRPPLRFDAKSTKHDAVALCGALRRWTERARKAQCLSEIKPHAESAVAYAEQLADEIEDLVRSLERVEERAEDSAAAVSAARFELADAKERRAKGSLDATEALALRDAEEIALAKVRALEHAHDKIVKGASIGNIVAKGRRAIKLVIDAEADTRALVSGYKSNGLSLSESTAKLQGESCVSEITIVAWALVEPDLLKSQETETTRDGHTGAIYVTRTREELEKLLGLRRSCALLALERGQR